MRFLGSLSSYEKKSYRGSLADSTGPVILYMLPGDTTLASFVLPICANGQTTINSGVRNHTKIKNKTINNHGSIIRVLVMIKEVLLQR